MTPVSNSVFLAIGRVSGQLTVETRRWLIKPNLVAFKRRRGGKLLLWYRKPWALRLGSERWLTRDGIRGLR